jgi:hypothetical protein
MKSALDVYNTEHSIQRQIESEKLQNEPIEIQKLMKIIKDLTTRVENLELRLAYSDRR